MFFFFSLAAALSGPVAFAGVDPNESCRTYCTRVMHILPNFQQCMDNCKWLNPGDRSRRISFSPGETDGAVSLSHLNGCREIGENMGRFQEAEKGIHAFDRQMFVSSQTLNTFNASCNAYLQDTTQVGSPIQQIASQQRVVGQNADKARMMLYETQAALEEMLPKVEALRASNCARAIRDERARIHSRFAEFGLSGSGPAACGAQMPLAGAAPPMTKANRYLPSLPTGTASSGPAVQHAVDRAPLDTRAPTEITRESSSAVPSQAQAMDLDI